MLFLLFSARFVNSFCFKYSFPKFWATLQEEFDANEGDLVQIKSVFTVLGFMTQSSLASIKTRKNLIGLESEYLKLRSNTNNFEELCGKFPAIKGIDSFTTGLTATMMDVITHLNPKEGQAIPLDDAMQIGMLETTKKNILEQGKKVKFTNLSVHFLAERQDFFLIKVCNSLSDDDVMFENNGSVCKIRCPDCLSVKRMSSSVNKDTGKRSFTVYNFSRHYKETHPAVDGGDNNSTSELSAENLRNNN